MDMSNINSDLINRRALCEYALNQKDKSVSPNDIMRFPSVELDIWSDGTLRISVSKEQLNKIGRVLVIEDGTVFCKQFYQDAQPEIIRCKDCVYQTESWSGIKYCEAHGEHIGKDYDYCSNARKKDKG